ncbi:MAG: DUF1570 domain-containing protein [Planctomycetaceae bacterium]|nr:DUF1570 domain-containing protein [Planctomycetaceae bacterium]
MMEFDRDFTLQTTSHRVRRLRELFSILLLFLPGFVAAQQQSTLDLRPSFSKRLPHSQVCGVVVCQSDIPLSGMQTILAEISQLQTDLKKYLAIPKANEKIELCLFSNEKTYLKFLEQEFPGAPTDRRALYVKKEGGPGIVLLQKTDDFEIDLRHEMTHAIIHASIHAVPIWLDEGLAKYFELKPEDRAFRNPYLSKIRFAAKFGAVPSLDRLENLEHIGEMDVREYRESWAWVHYLIHGSPQTHQLLASYLQMLAQRPNASSDKTAKSFPKLSPYLRRTINGPVADYKRHYKNWAE